MAIFHEPFVSSDASRSTACLATVGRVFLKARDWLLHQQQSGVSGALGNFVSGGSSPEKLIAPHQIQYDMDRFAGQLQHALQRRGEFFDQ